ncbi:hypothetical protein [Siccibacter colletis]|uniref:Uncharacterized protein n=1 Tax=Siccibacter colletis TaxID=1505757 RepID=A0ABY6JCY1_9ENTR|nr:hypothetical protein [Siccibacter colletis]UYU30318.1 hypothetical protein KFZ77_10440 [Siccibacter colletis]
MDKFEGTPAPWFVSPKKNIEVTGDMNVIQTNGSNCLGYHIAYACGWTDDSSTSIEATKNAQLIAAAPELLEELIETHAALCFTPDYIGSLRYERNKAAIAKALGK